MTDHDSPDRPFPLERRYRRRVLPIFALFVMSLVALTALAVQQAIEEIHLDSAAARVGEIAAELVTKVPAPWAALLNDSATGDERDRLAAALAEAAAERGIGRLKVYAPDGRTLFSTTGSEIGTIETNDALTDSVEQSRSVLLAHREPDGTEYHELYIPLLGAGGRVALVFELYEPIGHLRGILLRALPLPTLVPGLLLVVMLVVLGYLIRRAQGGIDRRAQRVRELGQRLESLVSATAVEATRAAAAGKSLAARRVELTLLYSDIRGFTDFAEAASPEDVVAFLNRIMTLQIGCVTGQGGDVDKMIGDALLVRFEGTGKEARAVAAALAILATVESAGLPRGVGIGVFTGPAVSGPIGPETRRDFTVIGDAVNIAARLCGQAQSGELVVDDATAGRSGLSDRFGPLESVRVRGRQQPIAIRRSLQVPAGGAAAQPSGTA